MLGGTRRACLKSQESTVTVNVTSEKRNRLQIAAQGVDDNAHNKEMFSVKLQMTIP